MFLNRRGFPLIEMLVVIGRVAIPASILFPVFARAREKARQASCLSNLKQIGLGMMMYSQDFDERLPLAGWSGTETVTWPDGTVALGRNTWFLRIYPYVKNVNLFNCPSATVEWLGQNTASIQYGMNSTVADAKLAAFAYPAQTLLVADTMGPASYVFLSSYRTDRWITPRHNDGANIAFCDGHAKWMKVKIDGLTAGGYQIPFTPADGVYYRADGTG